MFEIRKHKTKTLLVLPSMIFSSDDMSFFIDSEFNCVINHLLLIIMLTKGLTNSISLLIMTLNVCADCVNNIIEVVV